MEYCTNCGAQLTPGSVCSCQTNNQQQPQQQQQQNMQGVPYQQQPNPYSAPPYQNGVYPQQIKPARPGKNMILVSGILLTILGAIGILINISAIDVISGYVPSGWELLLYFEIFISFITLAFGITGISLCSKKESALIIVGFGAALIVLKTVDLIWALAMFSSYISSSQISGVIIGCVLPLLYIIGGSIRRNAEN